MKLQSESNAGEEQLPGKVAPEKQIPAAFKAVLCCRERDKQTVFVVC